MILNLQFTHISVLLPWQREKVPDAYDVYSIQMVCIYIYIYSKQGHL